MTSQLHKPLNWLHYIVSVERASDDVGVPLDPLIDLEVAAAGVVIHNSRTMQFNL